MKQRLLVMNGQRIVQHEQEGQWQTDKVEKAGNVKPGIYNLYLASEADKSTVHDGVIVHADANAVYQKVGKQLVQHHRSVFDKVPELGGSCSIRYEENRAITMPSSARLKRGLSR